MDRSEVVEAVREEPALAAVRVRGRVIPLCPQERKRRLRQQRAVETRRSDGVRTCRGLNQLYKHQVPVFLSLSFFLSARHSCSPHIIIFHNLFYKPM